MVFAETLSTEQRRKHQRQAVAACCFGCVAEQIVDTNAILILYLTMLGGSASVSMFSTVLTFVAYVLLLIPFSGMSSRLGQKLSATWSCIIACSAFLLMGAAPVLFSPESARIVVLGCIFLFGLTRPLYLSTWFPLLDNFLLPEERAAFFGRMRYIYMLLIAVLIFTVGQIMTSSSRPPLWVLQCTLAFAGLCQMGRVYFMNKFPVDTTRKPKKVHLTSSLGISVRNSPLVGYSLYQCFMNIAVTSAVPLMFIYMKSTLGMSNMSVLTVTAAGMGGSIAGYGAVGYMVRHFGMKNNMLVTHLLYFIVPASLFFFSDSGSTLFFACVNFAFGIAYALQNVINSSELMALAKPGNKSMAMAFCNTLGFFGTAVGRMGTTCVITLALFSEHWTFLNISRSAYHAFQLAYAVMTLLFAILLIIVPAVVPKHHDYYKP